MALVVLRSLVPRIAAVMLLSTIYFDADEKGWTTIFVLLDLVSSQLEHVLRRCSQIYPWFSTELLNRLAALQRSFRYRATTRSSLPSLYTF